jgi:hypothetical protein
MNMMSDDFRATQGWRGFNNRPRILVIGAVAAGILIMGLVAFFLLVKLKPKSDQAIIKQVGKHIMLPDETPSINTVEKASDLSGQPFFADLKDGDKILIYSKSARIVIYRPSENILVNVGPIIDDGASAPAQ